MRLLDQIDITIDDSSCNKEPNANPYHNLQHCINVYKWCEKIAAHENKEFAIELQWAALFHDFDHSGGRVDDNINLLYAVTGFNLFYAKWANQHINQWDYYNPGHIAKIVSIIRCTAFIKGTFPVEPITFEEKAIRDADLMSVFLPDEEAIEALNGLYKEISLSNNLTRLEFWDSNKSFFNKVTWYTDYGKLKSAELNNRIDELRPLFLSDADIAYNKYMDKSLPKWPQLLVVGKSITQEQAKDIIFRTDSFFTDTYCYAGGNDQSFNKWYRETANISTDDWNLSDYLREKIKFLSLRYLSNNYGSCSFIFGPNGWCNPSGNIYYSHNIGKWPEVSEVYDDWVQIAEAFPFLQIEATLFDGEECESYTSPICTFIIENGTVTLGAPQTNITDEKFTRDKPKVNAIGGEKGLPRSWYVDYANIIKSLVDDYTAKE
jgi:hypothetical protein